MAKKTFKSEMHTYFKEMNKYPLLTPEEEKSLGRELFNLNRSLDNIVISTPYGKNIYFAIDEKVKAEKRQITFYMDSHEEERKEVCTKEFNDFIRALKEDKEEAWLCLEKSWFEFSTKEDIEKQFYSKLEEYAEISKALPVKRARRTYEEKAFYRKCQALFSMDANKVIATYEKFNLLEERIGQIVHKIAESNLKLVTSIAKTYHAAGFTFFDLVQEGNEGILKRARFFDYRKNTRMSTYLSPWIKAGINKAIANTSSTITVPVHIRDKLNAFNRFIKKNPHINSENYLNYIKKISKSININPKRIRTAVEAEKLMITHSLDNNMRETNSNAKFKDLLEDKDHLIPGEELESKEIGSLIIKTINSMEDKKGSFIILSRFWKGMTLDYIGSNIFHVSRERIRQIEAKAKQDFEKKFIEIVKGNCDIPDSSIKQMFNAFSFIGGYTTEKEANELYNKLLPKAIKQRPKKRGRRPKALIPPKLAID